MDLSQRLKNWRKKHLKLSQVDFSKLTGIPLRTLQSYESGEIQPGSDALKAITNTTGLSINWLLTGSGPVKISEIPTELPADDELKKISDFLNNMSQEKRKQTLNDIFSRVQEIQRIDDMEKLIKKLERDKKTGS